MKDNNGPYVCILIRAHLRGLGGQFSKQKCSLENVNNSVQISSPQLLLSKRYSRLKLPFYNRFPMGGGGGGGGVICNS